MHFLLLLVGALLGKNKLSVLIYHQVFKHKNPLRPSEPDLAEFTWQMHIIKWFFKPMSISAALEHLDKGTLPGNAVCVTFDDGYLNNLEIAAPVLRQFSIPATVYVATGFSSGNNMWNDRLIDIFESPLNCIKLTAICEPDIIVNNTDERINAAHRLIDKIKYLPFTERNEIITKIYLENGLDESSRKMMNQSEIKELSNQGIEIGAHTVDHPILKTLSENEQKKQILESKSTLESYLGYKIKGFAYPNGKFGVDYDHLTRDLVESAEFEYAISTNWGVSSSKVDKYQLFRFTPWDKNPIKFHLRLLVNILRGKNN